MSDSKTNVSKDSPEFDQSKKKIPDFSPLKSSNDKSAKSIEIRKRFHDIFTKVTGKNLRQFTSKDLYWENRYYEKMIVNEILNAYFSLFSIIFSLAYYEFSYGSSGNYVSYLYMVFLFSIFLWINIILYEIVKLKYDQIRGLISNDETLITSGRYKSILIKISLTLIHPNPAFESLSYTYWNPRDSMYLTRTINSIFTIFVFTRSYFILRLNLYGSSYMTPETNVVCNSRYFNANLKFSLKALLKSHPIHLYLVTSFMMVGFFAFAVQVMERDVTSDFNNFLICVYYILVTMATLGYGDYFAHTYEGRIVAMFGCAFGVFLMSLIIISVNNMLETTVVEQNALFILNKLNVNEEVVESAKNLINQFSKIVSSKVSLKKSILNEDDSINPFKFAVKEFNEASLMCENFIGDNSRMNKIYNSLNGAMNDQRKIKEEQTQTKEELLQIKKEVDEIYQMIFDQEEGEDEIIEVDDSEEESKIEHDDSADDLTKENDKKGDNESDCLMSPNDSDGK